MYIVHLAMWITNIAEVPGITQMAGWLSANPPQDVKMFYSVFKLALWLNIGSVPSMFTYGQQMVKYEDQDFLFLTIFCRDAAKSCGFVLFF